MEATESIKIIERMMNESKKSLYHYSIHFLVWGLLLVPAGIIEFLMRDSELNWIVWPIVGIVGGIISGVWGRIEGQKRSSSSAMDRITKYTWTAFGFCLVLAIAYSLRLNQPPHAMILMLAGGATFISGGIAKFKPFIFGGIALEVAAIICAFIAPIEYYGLVFSGGLLLGYVIPGFLLRRVENDPA